MEFWNVKTLSPPVFQTAPLERYSADFLTLHPWIVEGAKLFLRNNILYWEAALLSRLIYNIKLQFRNDKGLKTMEKINRSLRAYLAMDIKQYFDQMLWLAPKKWTKHMPTTESLHYLLVRLQGVAKLLARIIQTCKIAVSYHRFRLHLGHFLKYSLVGIAMLSRIWGACRHMLQRCYTLYDHLVPFLKMSRVVRPWLPDGYVLPTELQPFVGLDLREEEVAVARPRQRAPPPPTFLVEDSDSEIEYCGEYVDLDMTRVQAYIDLDASAMREVIDNEDLGERVERWRAAKGPSTSIISVDSASEVGGEEDAAIASDESIIFMGS